MRVVAGKGVESLREVKSARVLANAATGGARIKPASWKHCRREVAAFARKRVVAGKGVN
jgi:hypothetical protein